ncbi:SpaA isopeptide-forming pilin-related protein [Bifidobacterium gallicum]|uniref:Putative Cna protein B-type domain protein n=1 Tax=Bifidobacterium gallicum DSM 20093 = LMG 11596 TaxID=561180 RepID=A0A087AKN7_9BIFI|nr:prealbumin-like fold domain-containing protein [Bifidobacterium gallicum]KFI59337.1 putative Cna protein B-type domain protein [Bifidobacterium gallicum DSM 20093 = LMG 11596]
MTITDCESETRSECPAAPAGEPAWARDVNPAAGAWNIEGLPWGQYRLKEAKAPQGYALEPGYFTPEGVTQDSQQAIMAVGPNANSYMFSLGLVKDEAYVELPVTDGAGRDTWLGLAGAVCIAVALMMGGAYVRRKNA